jgi:hypothetical protein
MASLRRGGQLVNGEAGDKDGLLEERRRQRAAMRERRRKETKEKRRKEEETKEKKNKGKEKEQRDKGNVTKVWSSTPPNSFLVTTIPILDASDATSCSGYISQEKRDTSQCDYDWIFFLSWVIQERATFENYGCSPTSFATISIASRKTCLYA